MQSSPNGIAILDFNLLFHRMLRLKKYIKTTIQPKYRKLLFAFGLYMYFYLEAEILFTDRIGELFGKSIGTTFYGIFCLAAAVGFFSFAFLRHLFSKTGRLLLIILSSAGVICTVATVYTGTVITAAFTLFVMLIAGITGASLLYAMAVNIKEKSVLGLFIALPYAAAFLVQYIVGYISPLFSKIEPLFLHFSIASAFFAAVILSPKAAITAPMRKKDIKPDTCAETKRYLIGAMAAGLIIFCLYGMMDGIIMTLHNGQKLNVYGWVRLLCIPGLFFTGWLADLRGGRYFPFASAAGMVAAVAAVFLFNTAETYNAALGSVYFFYSFMTMYSLFIFVHMADSTSAPAFWAGAGRGLKYMAGGVFALAGSLIFAHVSLLMLALIYTALLIVLFIILFFQGKLTPVDITVQVSGRQFKVPLDDMIKEHGITNREQEVLRALLSGKSTSAIAEEMVISTKTVQKYISSMISKTNAKSRAELLSIFTGQKS